MKKETPFRCIVYITLAILAGSYLMTYVKPADSAEKENKGPAACLACHGGTFEKLASKKPSFKAPSGEIINPHQYLDHSVRTPENTPSCTDCHSTHPIPPKDKVDLSKVNIDSCFLSCHHQQNFERCGNCHKKK